ncbi:hypothetical protein BDV96DRAFT_138925 [Lophiotrema nucula]|uniref:Uncharacterized protein n=1 Tax=Lophiotrema nucula TaxID=690887 RepID=A0A6A5ZTE8_9PLEO|nr:hypothetical protein BDV96DRAFT_138925 [Lophiotrema nucula]
MGESEEEGLESTWICKAWFCEHLGWILSVYGTGWDGMGGRWWLWKHLTPNALFDSYRHRCAGTKIHAPTILFKFERRGRWVRNQPYSVKQATHLLTQLVFSAATSFLRVTRDQDHSVLPSSAFEGTRDVLPNFVAHRIASHHHSFPFISSTPNLHP